jgi:glycine betaine/proline transport system substrate-binding protein
MKLTKTISALFLSLVLLVGSFGTANAAKRLHAAIADWTGGIITCEVAVAILEREMGYKVKQTVFPSGTGLWEAIAAGELDFACESWPSYAEADSVMLNEDLIYEGKVVGSYSGDGSVDLLGTSGIIGLSDYWIPRYAAEKFGIKTWKDLNKHKKEFATIETGNRGRLIGCPVAGWNCHDQKRLDLLGIDFQADELGTEAAAIAEAKAAYMRKEPFLLYLWSPHWFFGEFDMVGVQLPEHKVCDPDTFTEANNWKDCGTKGWPATGWAKDYTMNYGNPATFAKAEHSDAKKFFEKMSLQNIDQAKMLVEVDIKKRDVKEVVNEWLDNNPGKWKSWLP